MLGECDRWWVAPHAILLIVCACAHAGCTILKKNTDCDDCDIAIAMIGYFGGIDHFLIIIFLINKVLIRFLR